MLGAPAGAAAHAIVLESTPAHDAQLASSPPSVMLRFNSAIEHGLTRVTLTAGGGRPVPLAIASGEGSGSERDRIVIPLRPLPPGTYVIRYRVLATDGHLTEGALRFTIRAAQ